MLSERLTGETSLPRDFESLCMSKRLVRSFSQKLKKKSIRVEGEDEDEDDKRGVFMSCFPLYGRGGGCKVGADTGEEFGYQGCRRRSCASEEGKGFTEICGNEETIVDCFSYGMRDRFWRRNSKRVIKFVDAEQSSSMNVFLPDDILEMCLVRLPLMGLMNVRLVCQKWRHLTTTPRFMQMRREASYQSPWLFLFGVVKDGYCSSEIHAFDVSLGQWHKIDSEFLKRRFMFSVAGIKDDIYIVGGCSSLTNAGKLDRSSFKTHKEVLAFSPLTKSWCKVAPMKHARSVPVLGAFEVSSDCLLIRNQQTRQDRRFLRSRMGGVSNVYEDPHRLSVRCQFRHSLDENEISLLPSVRPYKIVQQRSEHSIIKDSRRFVLIAVGGLGSWDEPLDSCEIFDSISNKWMEIQSLPMDFGIVCSGVFCNAIFYVYSDSDKLAGYDIERGYWISIQTSPPTRVHEYYPKLISCDNRLFMLSVSWCEGDGQIGRRNKAVRKLWELNLMYLTWTEVSVHPDAPMDWNAAFIADRNFIFGVEMFKIFGQVLDFLTICDLSDARTTWSHISKNHGAHELDASSCLTKSMAVLHL